MNPLRPLAAALCALVLVLGLVGVTGGPASAAVGSIRASIADPMPGERFTISGRLPVKRGAYVTLQYWGDGGWYRLKRQRAGDRGRFKFAVTANHSTFRVKRYSKVTPRLRVAITQQNLTYKDPTGEAGTTVPVVATVSPARKGRTLSLLRSDGGGSTVVQRVLTDAYGRATVQWPCDGKSYYIYAEPFNGASGTIAFFRGPHACGGGGLF